MRKVTRAASVDGMSNEIERVGGEGGSGATLWLGPFPGRATYEAIPFTMLHVILRTEPATYYLNEAMFYRAWPETDAIVNGVPHPFQDGSVIRLGSV